MVGRSMLASLYLESHQWQYSTEKNSQLTILFAKDTTFGVLDFVTGWIFI
eukprot:m.259550 g.259550  ORF g.259550 m.259550 type:complete len:50 (-) comp19667_c0_seq2:1864-2013(-)